MKDLPKSARVVIIGGGVIGCSVAYHLVKKGWKRRCPVGTQATYLGYDMACCGFDRTASRDSKYDKIGKSIRRNYMAS